MARFGPKAIVCQSLLEGKSPFQSQLLKKHKLVCGFQEEKVKKQEKKEFWICEKGLLVLGNMLKLFIIENKMKVHVPITLSIF